MFWRFVHSAGGDFEALLSRDPPPSIEELLDDDEFLTECKTQNAKLVEILSRPEAVRALMGWVVVGLKSLEERGNETEEDKKRRTRFPAIATEVLCSDVWAIVETSLNPAYDLMKPFWESVLGPVPSQQITPLAQPPLSIENGPEDMDIDLTSPSTSAPPPPPPPSLPTSSDIPSSPPSSSSNPEEITVDEVAEDSDEFEDEPAPTPAPVSASTPEQKAQEKEHEEFHRIIALEMAAAAEDGKELAYGLWGRVNAVFLGKKTAEMLAFIRAQPFIVERLLLKIDSPAVVDLLFRIIQCEEMPAGQGVIDWLSSESIIPRLTTLLSPDYYPSHHDTATDLLKGIITMSAPAPGPFNPHSGSNEGGGGGGGSDNGAGGLGGMRNNKFARELVAEDTVERLVGYMLDDAGLLATGEAPVDPSLGISIPPPSTAPKPIDPALASLAATSSLTSSIAVFIELIRKNNSDYSEPHLFHTLRNGLMAKSSLVAAAAASRVEDGEVIDADQKDIDDRKGMEEVMEVINTKMGIVHLGSLLTVLSARLGSFQDLIKSPRTKLDLDTTADSSPPLTLERFRIVELYAELLHCSNMAILNRPNGTGPTYDDDGRLLGGLSGLDELSSALNGAEAESGDKPEEEVVLQNSKGLPVSSSSTDASSSSDEDSEDGEMEDISVEDPPAIVVSSDATSSVSPPPSSPTPAPLPPTLNLPPSSSDESTTISATPSDIASVSRYAVQATTAPPSVTSERAASGPGEQGDLPPGDLLKQKFIDHGLLVTLFDLFFAFPLNNFLHNVVYDIFQQVLTGRLDQGLNRDLIIVLFRDAHLVEKILHGQRLNDSMKFRLGFMGHLILIAEDTIKFLARCPPDLLAIVNSTFNQSEWVAFVSGPYQAAKERDNTVMGGGKPRNSSMSMGDEHGSGEQATDSDSDEDDEENDEGAGGGMNGTSRLASLSNGFGFGPASSGEDGDLGATTEQFSRYLAQQMSSGASDRHFESSSDDDDDDDADWIADSHSFDTSNSQPTQSSSTFQRSNSTSNAFPSSQPTSSQTLFDDKMGQNSSSWVDDDDAWGTFATGSTTVSSSSDDPFGDDFATFPSSSSPSNNNSEALAALEWNDASFSQEFKDVDSDDDLPAASSSSSSQNPPSSNAFSSSSARIAIPSWNEDDEGDDDPSTPTGKTTSASWGSFGSSSKPDFSSSTSPSTSPITSHLSSSPSTQNLSMHATNMSLSTSPSSSSPFQFGGGAASIFTNMSAISPPDPSLLQATNEEEPLGPGVGKDVEACETEEGTMVLEKMGEDGNLISVPMDEIALAVEADLQKKEAEREAELKMEQDSRSG